MHCIFKVMVSIIFLLMVPLTGYMLFQDTGLWVGLFLGVIAVVMLWIGKGKKE